MTRSGIEPSETLCSGHHQLFLSLPRERGECDLAVVVEAVLSDAPGAGYIVEAGHRVAREQDATLLEGDRVVPGSVPRCRDDAWSSREVERLVLL